jgi:hypothetical protein
MIIIKNIYYCHTATVLIGFSLFFFFGVSLAFRESKVSKQRRKGSRA